MSLKRSAEQQTKISDFFGKRPKHQDETDVSKPATANKHKTDASKDYKNGQAMDNSITDHDGQASDRQEDIVAPEDSLHDDNDAESKMATGSASNTSTIKTGKDERKKEVVDLMSRDDVVFQTFAKDRLKRLGVNDLNIVDLKNHVDLSVDTTEIRSKPTPDDVKMPFYISSLTGSGPSRWEVIKEALGHCESVRNAHDLGRIILKYNPQFKDDWNFDGLDLFFNTMEPDGEELSAILETLKKMSDLAVQLDSLCPQPIPFLRHGKDGAITLTQRQIASLLANAFFCTFPQRNIEIKNGRKIFPKGTPSLPTINFSALFYLREDERRRERRGVIVNKLRCLFHYFKRVVDDMPDGRVTFHRQVLDESKIPKWSESKKTFTRLHVASKGMIEHEEGFLQVDFANKYVGGGALSRGCVQEEIRFMISPELIVSCLFTERLGDLECLIVTGCETFSKYDGYAESFAWTGDHRDETKRDVFGRRLTQVTVIDAINLQRRREQFDKRLVDRELNKAYCGFYDAAKDARNEEKSAVSTGNWGCGAFGGDKQLKSLIQMMSAAEAGRDVCYFTFDDDDLVEEMSRVYTLVTELRLTVGEVYRAVIRYKKKFEKEKRWKAFYDYLLTDIPTIQHAETK